MRKTWIRDWGRRLLIALLLVSAVLLLRHTGYYAGIRSRLQRSRSAAEQSAGTEATLAHPIEAIVPLAMTVRSTENGGRYGTAYDAADTAAVFQRFSVDLSEALGSAGAPAGITDEEFRSSLERCCVAMHFAFPVRLELLSGWLGVDMNSPAAEHSARFLCISAAEEEALLCYRTEDGSCYACTTAVNADGFRGRTEEYAPNGALYAWEDDRLETDGETLLLDVLPTPAVLASKIPLPREGEADAMLTAVGMNSFVTNSYTEADGTSVYISDENTMRISESGTVLFRRAGFPDAETKDDLTTAVSRAWTTAKQCLGQFAGVGELRLVAVTQNEALNSYTVLLDYAVDGIPVRLGSGHAAEIVVRGGKVIQAQMELRKFARTERNTDLLPCLQAAAIAARAQGQPELVYAESGEATECMWVITDG